MTVQKHFPNLWTAFANDAQALARLNEGVRFDALCQIAAMAHAGNLAQARQRLLAQPAFWYGQHIPQWTTELKPPAIDISDFPNQPRKP